MHREAPSPIDLPEPELEEDGLGWAFGVIVIAALLLLVTNAVSLRDWIDDQPPGPVQAQAAALADQWLEFTQALGLAAPRDLMHKQWKRAEAARFHAGPDEPGSEEPAAPPDQR